MSENIVEIDALAFGYKGSRILKDISLCLKKGEILGLIGPNGSGKSTLLKLISGILSPWEGEVSLKGKLLAAYGRREIARIMASVSQDIEKDFPFTVREIVAMGRAPYTGRFSVESRRDTGIIEEAMELTDIRPYAERYPNQLSGGERQRMIIARALAQEPEVLLMDEPTSHLDLNHQMEINSLILRMKEEKGLAVIYVTHDLNSAAGCCDRVIMLDSGSAHAEGDVSDVITVNNIEAVYGCHTIVDRNPETGRPRVTPLMEPVHG